MRYRMTLDYVGTDFCGWQVQPDKKTVQGTLSLALAALTGESPVITGSGRTDAGVHALMQTAHFDLEKEWEPHRLTGGINHYLPKEIHVQSVERCIESFHARFDCKEKSYIYLMYRAPERAVLSGRAFAVDPNIDVKAMNEAAKKFVGEKDFTSFMASGSDVKTAVRRVTAASVTEDSGSIVFTVSANGFLYNMVRIMTALLIRIGSGLMSVDDVEKIIEARDRTLIAGTAPACGLYLKSQTY